MSLQTALGGMQDIEVLFVSPLRRAIQTAAYVFADLLNIRQVRVVLVPYGQEVSEQLCDVGQDASVVGVEAASLIAQAAPRWDCSNLDTRLIDKGWNSKVKRCDLIILQFLTKFRKEYIQLSYLMLFVERGSFVTFSMKAQMIRLGLLRMGHLFIIYLKIGKST